MYPPDRGPTRPDRAMHRSRLATRAGLPAPRPRHRGLGPRGARSLPVIASVSFQLAFSPRWACTSNSSFLLTMRSCTSLRVRVVGLTMQVVEGHQLTQVLAVPVVHRCHQDAVAAGPLGAVVGSEQPHGLVRTNEAGPQQGAVGERKERSPAWMRRRRRIGAPRPRRAPPSTMPVRSTCTASRRRRLAVGCRRWARRAGAVPDLPLVERRPDLLGSLVFVHIPILRAENGFLSSVWGRVWGPPASYSARFCPDPLARTHVEVRGVVSRCNRPTSIQPEHPQCRDGPAFLPGEPSPTAATATLNENLAVRQQRNSKPTGERGSDKFHGPTNERFRRKRFRGAE